VGKKFENRFKGFFSEIRPEKSRLKTVNFFLP